MRKRRILSERKPRGTTFIAEQILSFLSRKTSGIPMKCLLKCLLSSFRDFVAQYYSAQYWGTGATPIINTDVLLF